MSLSVITFNFFWKVSHSAGAKLFVVDPTGYDYSHIAFICIFSGANRIHRISIRI